MKKALKKAKRRAKKLLANKLVWALVAVIAIVVVLVVVLSGGEDEEQAPAVPTAGKVSAKDLAVGTCVTDATSTIGDVTTFDAIACSKPHDGEVFTVIALEGTAYPGVAFVTGKGQRGCRARLRRQATKAEFESRDLGFHFVYPTKQSWAQGDHDVTCMATFKRPRVGALAQRPAATTTTTTGS